VSVILFGAWQLFYQVRFYELCSVCSSSCSAGVVYIVSLARASPARLYSSANHNFEKHIKSLHTLDPHSWWSKVKHFRHPSDSNPLRCLQDSDSDLTLAESINDFFVSISAALRPLDSNTFLNLDSDHTPNFIIDPVDVDARLPRIKIHEAPRPDGIPNWLLRDFSSLLCRPLAAT